MQLENSFVVLMLPLFRFLFFQLDCELHLQGRAVTKHPESWLHMRITDYPGQALHWSISSLLDA